ncbi:MAG: farnesyl diphosphate synthase [Thiotrichaceae bacterium]
MSELAPRLQYYQQRIEKVLDRVLPEEKLNPQHLHEAMRYSVLDGGKRVRPLLVYATGEALGVDCDQLDIPAAAIELIHVYSLIHDDLPAMDDDDLRRNKPTCHKAFDEATAILAGDALQALSSFVLAHSTELNVSAKKRLKLIEILTHASGSRGMAGGQAIDLASTGRKLSQPELENMHIHKTGALIRACVLMAIECSDNSSKVQQQQLDHFAKCVGLAFQVRDDILDIESDTETLGKTQGADVASNKATYPSILGMQGARQQAVDLYAEAIAQLGGFGGDADNLRNIADFIVNRLK